MKRIREQRASLAIRSSGSQDLGVVQKSRDYGNTLRRA
jgi:hypothetical protein